MLAAEVLLGVAEGILDGPAALIARIKALTRSKRQYHNSCSNITTPAAASRGKVVKLT